MKNMHAENGAAAEGRQQDAKLSALVRLLDDESPVVRNAVTSEILAYGPMLGERLRGLEVQPEEAEWKVLGKITGTLHRRKARLAWPHWMNIPDDLGRLERALTLLAEFQNGPRWRLPLGEMLDGLAAEYGCTEEAPSPESLARFLFSEKGLRVSKGGAFPSGLSNLAEVIETGRGLPISLVCVYLLVGARAGLDIHACNWPRHFLARYRNELGLFVVDPANQGAVVDAETFLSMQGTSREAAEAVLSFEVDAATVVTRILGNLARAFRQERDEENCLLTLDLLRDVESRLHAGTVC